MRAAIAEADKKQIAKPFHVDLLKAPHHGSANNVEPGFFRRITADHYVFSGNGNHHNPDPETLRMLAAARGDADYTIHFTFTADQHETETSEKFAAALTEVHEWVTNEKPANCKVVHRASEDDLSVAVDLSD